jgi:choline kinase
MTGLVLAAGLGKRLAPLTDQRPKGLIELGGRTLLARLLDGFRAAGVRETAIVVGYRHEQIRAALGTSHRGMPLRYLMNPSFEKGPRFSLWTGRGEFERDDVVLADGDVLFAPALLERLLTAPRPNVFLGEPDFIDTGEELILYTHRPEDASSGFGPRVVAIRRGVTGPPATPYHHRAEWVGFAKVGRTAGPELVATLDRMVREGRMDGDYEEALDTILPQHPFLMCPTDGLPWIEIDFPQDLDAAHTDVLPRIDGRCAG